MYLVFVENLPENRHHKVFAMFVQYHCEHFIGNFLVNISVILFQILRGYSANVSVPARKNYSVLFTIHYNCFFNLNLLILYLQLHAFNHIYFIYQVIIMTMQNMVLAYLAFLWSILLVSHMFYWFLNTKMLIKMKMRGCVSQHKSISCIHWFFCWEKNNFYNELRRN